MAWQGIVGHDAIVERFRRSLERGALSSLEGLDEAAAFAARGA